MKCRYILAHDLGTSGNKATLYNLEGGLMASRVAEYPTYYPGDGQVEQCAGDWWKAVCDSSKDLINQAGISPSEIACVCFSAQMMGCLLVDGGGEPLRNALIWADTRSAAQEQRMLRQIDMETGYRITGHRISASYSAAKLLWVRDNEPALYKKAGKMLQAKEYVIFKLTGEFVTDYSDAGGTNLMDIEKKCWSEELLSAFGIRTELLPDIYPSTHVAGGVTAEAARACGLLEGTPVVTGGGDGSCAAVGAGIVREGKTYNVVGSSSWISTATAKPYFDNRMRTFNWVHLDEKLYTPCGTMQAAGYSYAWFRDTLCGEERRLAELAGTSAYKAIDELALSAAAGAGSLLYLPYLLGERSPHWDHNARGAFIGLGISTSKADMARSVLEGVGYNLKIILDTMEEFAPIGEIVMIGGGTKGKAWLQILSDIWQKKLVVPQYVEEATSLGAAVCGGVGVGAFPDFSAAERFVQICDTIAPNQDDSPTYQHMYRVFCDAYKQLRPVYKSLANNLNRE